MALVKKKLKRSVKVFALLATLTGGFIALETLAPDASAQASANQDEVDQQASKDLRIVETVMRMSNFDIESRPQVKESVERYLKSVAGTQRYLDVVEKLKPSGQSDALLELAIAHPDDNLGVKAARLLFQLKERQALSKVMNSEEEETAIPAIMAVGRVGNNVSVEMLSEIVNDDARSMSVRNAAVRSLGRSNRGQTQLLELVSADQLPEQLQFSAGDVLHASTNAAVREKIETLLPRPESGDSMPLPPLDTLVKARGNVAQGLKVFGNEGTCIKCHKIGSEGKEVGPDLSEIGSKLSRQAMYESILEPSAGISHNYESFVVSTLDGQVITGIMISETESEVVLKDAEAIVHKIKQDDIDELIKQKISIMPAGLQKSMTQQQLVDLVEYLMSLKKTETE